MYMQTNRCISHEFQPVNSTQEVPRANTNNSVLDNFITLIKI